MVATSSIPIDNILYKDLPTPLYANLERLRETVTSPFTENTRQRPDVQLGQLADPQAPR